MIRKSKVVLVGYADPKEAGAAKLASERAASAQKYLQDKKGVDASRVEVRTAAGEAGAGRIAGWMSSLFRTAHRINWQALIKRWF